MDRPSRCDVGYSITFSKKITTSMERSVDGLTTKTDLLTFKRDIQVEFGDLRAELKKLGKNLGWRSENLTIKL